MSISIFSKMDNGIKGNINSNRVNLLEILSIFIKFLYIAMFTNLHIKGNIRIRTQ